MDIKFLLNNIHKEVSCSVCLNTYTNPKQLPCLHSFCLQCLNRILQTRGGHDFITCPDCKREIRVSGSGNLNDLPTNFRINSLLDVVAIKEHVTTAVKCGNCEKRSFQSFYCFQCCAFWCKDSCIGFHNGIKAYKKHYVLALTDFKDEDFGNLLKCPAFCQKKHHGKDELKFFCKVCEIPICDACALTDHEGHTNMPLEQAGNERKLQVKSVIESLSENVQKRRDIIAEIDKACTQIKEKAANVQDKAQKFAEDLIRVIEVKKQEICNEAENQAAEWIQRLATQKNEIEDQTKMTETVIEQTDLLLKRSRSAELVQLDKSLDAMSREEVRSDEGELVDGALESFCQSVFLENTTLMNEMNTQGIGSFKTVLTTSAYRSRAEGPGITEVFVGYEAQFILTTRNAKGEKCYDENDRVTVEIRNDQGQDCATNALVQDSKDGSYTISYVVKNIGKYDVSVNVNGKRVHGSPFPVQVKPKLYRYFWGYTT